MIKQIKFEWTGVSPIIPHSDKAADPEEPVTREMKRISGKGRNKTEADISKLARLDWEAALYYDPQIGPYIPDLNIEACIAQGAKQIRGLSKKISSAISLEEACVPLKTGAPNSLDKMYSDKRYVFRKSVVVAGKRVMRVRPIFPKWSLTFIVNFDDDIVEARQVITSCIHAGQLSGLGDWRPSSPMKPGKYGRFSSEVIDE